MIWLVLKQAAQVLRKRTLPEGSTIKISGGDRVRIVETNGCMANAGENIREGVVIGISYQQLYGDYSKYRYAKIMLDNGDIVDKPAEQRYWTMHDELPEYQE